MSSQTLSTPSFQPSGIITLTTDFGLTDPFVGVMKGQILQRFPAARIVDLTHAISVHRPAEAGFWLGRSFHYFPAGTVHVAVVDPGVGGRRPIAVLEAQGHLFMAPDNGLLAAVVGRVTSPAVLRHLDLSALRHLGLAMPSATFHGRDIFAPVAAEVASGRQAPVGLGPTVAELATGELGPPSQARDELTGTIVTVDHFGNLLTNLDADALARIPCPTVRAGGREIPLRRTYSEVAPGQYVALVNSFGVLEIARAESSAAAGLGLGRGASVTVRSSRHAGDPIQE
jgi:S-adenosyl-L-methionine hydrolase (adenosine-forming)